jgi:hypothetical protein
MSLEVLQRATWTDLIQLETVKSRLEIAASDSSKDSYLGELIAEASDAIVAFCNRPFARQQYTETVQFDGSEYLVLSRSPIESFEDPVVDGFSISGGVISDENDGMLFRKERWIPVGSDLNFSFYPVPDRAAKVWADVPYWAGYLLSGQDSDWPADTSVAAGAVVKSSDSSVLLRFECTTAGTTDSSEPVWPTADGETVTDNNVVWTARAVHFQPREVFRAAWETVHSYWNTDFRDTEILQRRISEEDWLEYARVRDDRPLPVTAMGLLKNYRRSAVG